MEAAVALIALTLMEVVLGIDNIIFIAILTDKLPEEQQPFARRVGLGAAMLMRIGLLLALTAVMRLTDPVFMLTTIGFPESLLSAEHFDEINNVSWRDIILVTGGLFLIGKSVREVHEECEGGGEMSITGSASLPGVLMQIVILDIIFSLDSVITAVGMVKPEQLWVMITAIILAVGVMLAFAGHVSGFVKRHPTIKMLALSFLIMIGVMLVAEGIGTHINKWYIYFAMAFSLAVEGLNMRVRNRGVRNGSAPSADQEPAGS